MSIFKKLSDWNEEQKAINKAKAKARMDKFNAFDAKVKAKLQGNIDKAAAGVAENKAGFEATKAELKAELKAMPSLKEIAAQAKADYKAAKESPEYQELKAKSDKQCSFAWKMIKWGLILMLIGPVVACTGAAVLGVVAG